MYALFYSMDYDTFLKTSLMLLPFVKKKNHLTFIRLINKFPKFSKNFQNLKNISENMK